MLMGDDAPHFCPECKHGFGCEEEPCTAAYESVCNSCDHGIEVVERPNDLSKHPHLP